MHTVTIWTLDMGVRTSGMQCHQWSGTNCCSTNVTEMEYEHWI